MHSTLRIFSSLVFLLVPIVAPAEDGPLIGVIAAQTGVGANIGKAVWNGAALAQKDLPSRVQFQLEDDGYSPAKAISAFESLARKPQLRAVIVFGSPSATVVADRAEKARIPMIYIAMAEKAALNRQFIFRNYPSSAKQSTLLFRAASSLRSLALVTLQNEGPLSLKQELTKQFGGRIVVDEEVAPSELDMRVLALKIKKSAPEGVILNLIPPHIGALARQLRTIGYTGQFLSGPPLADVAEIRAGGPALVGAKFVAIGGKTWRRFCDERFQGNCESSEFGAAYDVATLLIRHLREHPDSRGEEIVRELHSTEGFSGAFGVYGSPEGNNFNPDGTVYEIQEDGRLQAIE